MAECVIGPAKIASFEKVSYPIFADSVRKLFQGQEYDWPEDRIHACYDAIELPKRATSGSAGYDFKSPFHIDLCPGETVTIPTGIRVKIEDGWFLMCAPRSGLGFKYRLQLDNTVGIIDSDYYYSDNEGHIMLKLTNDSKLEVFDPAYGFVEPIYGRKDKKLHINIGQGFAQGIFVPYGVAVDDDSAAVRNGGFGSTGV